MRTHRQPRRAAGFSARFAVACLLLAGCSSLPPLGPAGRSSATTSGAPPGFSAVVGAAAAHILDTAPAGTLIRLHDAPALTLGPQYESARGLTCRTGWPTSAGEVTVYAFCRTADGWYAVSPVVIGRS